MTSKNTKPAYRQTTLEFATVAYKYCSWIEALPKSGVADFSDMATKLLPLLYVKAALLDDVEEDVEEGGASAAGVSWEMYEKVRTGIAEIMGEKDAYLDALHPEMPLSDAPVAVFISEDMADVYQSVGDFCYLFREGYEEVMNEAIARCRKDFAQYWGQRLLNALKALHSVRYSEDDFENGTL